MPPNMRNLNGPSQSLNTRTRQVIKDVFAKLDYAVLDRREIYCEEGGEGFLERSQEKMPNDGTQDRRDTQAATLPKRKKPLR